MRTKEEINRLIAENPEIPIGPYCYSRLSEPDKTGRMKVKSCPYFVYQDFSGVSIPWCTKIDLGSIPLYVTDKDMEIIERNHPEIFNNKLDAFLLFDQVKCCGINDFDELENDDFAKLCDEYWYYMKKALK